MKNLDSLTDLEILTLTIIGEARGESRSGQIAVGSVIRNRVLLWNKTYREICLQHKQFSCWNENDVNRPFLGELADEMFDGQFPHNRPEFIQCSDVANGIFDDSIPDNTNGSIYYLENRLFKANTVSWAKNTKNIVVIGNQTFFNV